MHDLHEVEFLPAKIKVAVTGGTSLLEAARIAGLRPEAPCNGRGTCGKCRVLAEGNLSPPTEKELAQLSSIAGVEMRLACRAIILGPVRAELPESRSGSFLTVEEGQRKELKLKPRGYRPGLESYGIALDIGTTSIVAELIDMASGQSLGVSSCLNPQTAYGGDVLTRITYAANRADGVHTLQSEVAGGINRLIENLCRTQDISTEQVLEITVAANTTMLHLLLGVNPRSLAVAPYQPVFTRETEVSPGTVRIRIAADGLVTLLPSASAFVGADIIAGLLATDFHHCKEPSLFIDIGTNGEIVAIKDGQLAGTSSAAGPALEGMNITCGCRAEQGAIEAVTISVEGTVNLKTIGSTAPTGLCGSGLIDLIAELVRTGVIEPSGRLTRKENLPPGLAGRIVSYGGQPAFLVAETNEIILTQKDIRQVQLAKGAMAAGIALLLKELDLEYSEVRRVLVAGAFGYHLKPASLTAIGLLPAALRDKISFVGNTAKEGAKAVLLNRDAAIEAGEIRRRLKIKELSFLPEFQDCFVRQLGFPTLIY